MFSGKSIGERVYYQHKNFTALVPHDKDTVAVWIYFFTEFCNERLINKSSALIFHGFLNLSFVRTGRVRTGLDLSVRDLSVRTTIAS